MDESRQDELDKYLEEREKLDAVFNEKFTKVLTVVFTDLKGSTTIAETEGDLVSRMLIKDQNQILLPAIEDNDGVFVKSIGDGTLSYFEHAQNAVRAAVRIQQGMDKLNMSRKYKTPILMRIGMHTGKCIVEKSDIAGDVVNTASRFESSATPGDIYISEETYNQLSDKSENYCRFIKQITLKGKKDAFNAYKVFWNPEEIELDKEGRNAVDPSAERAASAPSFGVKFFVLAILVIGIGLAALAFLTKEQAKESEHSVRDSISQPVTK